MDSASAGFLIILVALVVYFIPTIIALSKQNVIAIFMLNLFLGWTFIGWVCALIWALCKEPEKSVELAKQKS